MSYPARPKPGTPKASTTKQWAVQVFESLRFVPLVAACALLLLIAIHPRNVAADEQAGNRFMASDKGYKASVDKMAELGIFQVETLPQALGLPERSRVIFDENAISQMEEGQELCLQIEPSFGQRFGALWNSVFGSDEEELSRCRKLLQAYQKATYLNQDMVRASRQTWIVDGERILGVRRQAHSLRESGFDPDAAVYKIFYKPNTREGKAAWALVDPISSQSEPLLSDGNNGECDSRSVPAAFATYCFRAGVAIVYPPGGTALQVRYNGEIHNIPGQSGPPNVIALREGDTVAFGAPGDAPSTVLQLLQRPQTLSEIRSGVRVRDPAFAGISSQIDTALSTNLTSSIDPDLQVVLQDELDRTLANAPRSARSSLRGAILLMDGLDGKIAAGATFPNTLDQLLPADRDKPRRQLWLKQNQVFETLPVGSTAKIPFAAAIATAEPQLMDMKLASSGTMRYDPRRYFRSGSFAQSRSGARGSIQLLGTGLTNVDFRTAIARSDNFYAVKLVREAWMANRSAPQDADWLHNLHLLSCSASDLTGAPGDCPIYLWGDKSNPDRGLVHRAVTFQFDPEKVRQSPHFELFYGPLGNGSYNWSLAQLTQSYARFLSGKSVSATLSNTGHSGDPIENQFRGPGYERAWSLVTKGMRDVISGGGTAKELADLETKFGPNLFLYAKTGTPTVSYREGVDGKVFVLAAIRTQSGLPPTSLNDLEGICSLRFLSINLQYDTSALKVTRRLLEDNRRVREWMVPEC